MATETSNRTKPSGILTLLWALFFFFIFALLMTFWVRCSGSATVAQDERGPARMAKREELDKADIERLSTAGVIDKAKGLARLPIAEAKKLSVTELKGKSVVASQLKVEPPLPMPPPADPNATEPPPMALPSAPQGADTFRFQQLEASAAPNEATPAPANAAAAAPAAPATPAPTAPPANAPTPLEASPAAPAAPQTTPAAPGAPAEAARPPLINSTEPSSLPQ
jgi:hypothetical protein